MSVSLATTIGLLLKGFMIAKMTAGGFSDYMSAWDLKILETTSEPRTVRVDIQPRKEARDLVLDVSVLNSTLKPFWVSELELGRVRIYLKADSRSTEIPYGLNPFMRSLKEEEKIFILPGHSVHREFRIKDYYSRKRAFSFVSVQLWETQVEDEGTLDSEWIPIPKS